MEDIRIAGLENDSIVDGPGLRLTVFMQGCEHNCNGCHNPETHDKHGGKLISATEILNLADKNPLLDGVTFSGGEPFLQCEKLVPLAKEIKNRKLSLVVYTGFLFENLIKDEKTRELLEYADILIDGPFVLSEKTFDLPFVGSRNQRVIDVPESLKTGTVVRREFN